MLLDGDPELDLGEDRAEYFFVVLLDLCSVECSRFGTLVQYCVIHFSAISGAKWAREKSGNLKFIAEQLN